MPLSIVRRRYGHDEIFYTYQLKRTSKVYMIVEIARTDAGTYLGFRRRLSVDNGLLSVEHAEHRPAFRPHVSGWRDVILLVAARHVARILLVLEHWKLHDFASRQSTNRRDTDTGFRVLSCKITERTRLVVRDDTRASSAIQAVSVDVIV